MKPEPLARLEKTLVVLLLGSFTLPLVLGFWLFLTHDKSRQTLWLRNATLNGGEIQPKKAAFSPATLLSGKFQASLAANYDTGFPGRELFIRLFNEIDLRLFRTSGASVLVGPNLSLFEMTYAREYCLSREGKDTLPPLVDKLRRMQDFCDARGIAFALVITPSKAAIYPESLPAAWLRRYRPEPRAYDDFVPLLRARGVRFVDGHRLTADLKPAARVPLFPLGGIHWGDPAALATTNALLALLAREGLRVSPDEAYRTADSDLPMGQDLDLASLVNTVSPWRYPVTSVTLDPVSVAHGDRPDMVLVGGSFVWSMMRLLDETQQFSEFDFYRYYRLSQYCRSHGSDHLIAEPTPPVNFDTDVFASDALVLEANEETLPRAEHLRAFLHDALAVLPDPAKGKPPFHYESPLLYRWGDAISFVRGSGRGQPRGDRGLWRDHFHRSVDHRANGDAVLSADDAGAGRHGAGDRC